MYSPRFRRSKLARGSAVICAALMLAPSTALIARGATFPGYAGNTIPARASVAIVSAPGGVKVNTFLGTMFFTRTDLHTPGRGFPLEVQLTYNSKDCAIDSLFGFGWRLSYDMSVLRLSANQFVVNWGDGRKDQFTLTGGIYTPVNEGVHATMAQPDPATLIVTTAQQTRFSFAFPAAIGASTRLQTMLDSNGNSMSFTYNAAGQLTAITDASGRSLSLAYSGSHVSSITDANISPARTFSYQYDATGNLTRITDALGNATNYAYDTGHRMKTATDPLGVTQFTYSGLLFELSSVSRLTPSWVLLSKRSFTYAMSPLPTTTITDRISSSQNAVTVFQYDASNRLTSTVDPLGHNFTRTYDAAGNVATTTDPLGHTTQYSYDTNGNMLSHTDAMGHTSQFAYDGMNRLTSSTDPNGHTTSMAYDGAGNMISVTDPLGAVTQYAYDPSGQLLSRINANNATTSFTYDAFGNRTSVTDPLNHTTSYGYDGAGNVISRTDANGHTVQYGYDAMDRRIRRTLPDASHADFTYDAAGNMLSAKDPNSDLTFTYDANSRVTQYRDNKVSRLIKYGYDGVGNLIQRTGPEPGVGANYAYDADGRMTLLSHNADQFTCVYDPADRMTRSTLPNGSYTDYGYDAADRLTSLINRRSDGTITSSYDYTLDPAGNRTGLSLLGGDAATSIYDGRNQLIRETRTGSLSYDHQFGYDPVGNRIMLNEDGVITQSFYDGADRLMQQGPSTSFGYDANGNQTSRNDAGMITTTTYDSLDRQTGYLTSGTQASYGYDALDRRISRTVGSVTTRYVYDGRNRVTSYANGVFQAEDLFGPGSDWNLAKYIGGQSFYYQHDGSGSVTQLLDLSEGVRNRYDYDAWGNRVAQSESAPNDYTFRGRLLDRESGWYDCRDREYDSSNGRFSQSDSIDLNTGRTRYDEGGNAHTGSASAFRFGDSFKEFIKKAKDVAARVIKKARGLDDDSSKSDPKGDKYDDDGKNKGQSDDSVKPKPKPKKDKKDKANDWSSGGSNATNKGDDDRYDSGNHPK